MNDIAFFGHERDDYGKARFTDSNFYDTTNFAKLRYEEAEEIFYCYASKPEATRFMSWPTHRSLVDTKAFLQYAAQGWKAGTDYSYSIRTQGGRF
jgi:RimJ/RimL family protein N-acetyltransferase